MFHAHAQWTSRPANKWSSWRKICYSGLAKYMLLFGFFDKNCRWRNNWRYLYGAHHERPVTKRKSYRSAFIWNWPLACYQRFTVTFRILIKFTSYHLETISSIHSSEYLTIPDFHRIQCEFLILLTGELLIFWPFPLQILWNFLGDTILRSQKMKCVSFT